MKLSILETILIVGFCCSFFVIFVHAKTEKILINENEILKLLNNETKSSGIMNKVSGIVENFIQAVKSPFVTVYDKVKNVINSAYTKVASSIEKSLEPLGALTSELEKVIKKAKENDTSGKATDCAEKLQPNIERIKNETEIGLQECAKEFLNELQDQKDTVRDDLQELDNKIEELRLSAVTCIYFNPVTTTKCVYNRLSQYAKILGKITSVIKQAAEDATFKASRVPRGLVRCTREHVVDGSFKIAKVGEEFEKCIEK